VGLHGLRKRRGSPSSPIRPLRPGSKIHANQLRGERRQLRDVVSPTSDILTLEKPSSRRPARNASTRVALTEVPKPR
jgi:hypothetical protein